MAPTLRPHVNAAALIYHFCLSFDKSPDFSVLFTLRMDPANVFIELDAYGKALFYNKLGRRSTVGSFLETMY